MTEVFSLALAGAAFVVACWAVYRVEVRFWRDRELKRRMDRFRNMTATEAQELFGHIARFDDFTPNPNLNLKSGTNG